MKTSTIDYPGYGSFKIYAINNVLEFRAKSFLTKEPTTIDWIKSLEKDSILIDVGANIGIYTIPCALFHVKKVIAIEHEIRNYNMLLSNLDLNQISNDVVEALPLAVSTEYAETFTKIFLSQDIQGGSCHQVGRNQDYLLRKTTISNRKSRSVYCISLASIVSQAATNHSGPIHIKVDVDGIEEDVCQSLFDSKMINRISSLQVELNPKIPHHTSLIEKLCQAGFSFSEKQVELSKRKSGLFEGFAEIVFKRNISLDVVKVLPNEVVKMLGYNYKPNPSPKNIDKLSNLFSISKSKIVCLSRMPTTFALKQAFDSRKSSTIFHDLSQKALLKQFNSFEFQSKEGIRLENQRRFTIKNTMLRQYVPGYLDELIRECSSDELAIKVNYMSEIASKSLFDQPYLSKSHPGSENQYIDKLNMYCRIRHFVDLYGFSLGKHNDSRDTYCALIAPILPGSTSTSLVSGSFFNRDIFNTLNNKNFDGTHKNEFSDGFYFTRQDGNAYVEYEYSEASKEYIKKVPFSLHPSDLRAGEILVIPNPMWVAFGSDVKSNSLSSPWSFWRKFGHGVLPPVSEPYRPVLLIDFMMAEETRIKSSDRFIESDEKILIDLGKARDFIHKSQQ